MVGHIHQAIAKERKNKIHINSKNATSFIILDLINNDNGDVEDILKFNGIKSSDDFGTVVRRLCEEGALIKEDNDHYEEFNGHFKTESINDFIKLHKLKKDRDWYKNISYSLYIVGFIIVISSYITSVPNKTGWIGWALGMLGWLLLTYKNKIVVAFNKVLKIK